MAYQTTCPDCGRTVEADAGNFLELHSKYEGYPPGQEMCPMSRLKDINPPAGDVFDGNPYYGGAWEQNRRKH